jgi:hypothetical protein
MSGGQLLTDEVRSARATETTLEDYLGAGLEQIDNAGGWPVDPDDGPLTRTSYVYQSIYQIGTDEYGGIQLRARVHTYGDPPEGLREWLSRAAHRAAYLYDSSIQTSAYGPQAGTRGTAQGDGYLSGFNSVQIYRNWEDEQVAESEAETPPLVVDWSVEIYRDDTFDSADLGGIAQGLANPYDLEVRHREGREAVSIAPHKWDLKRNEARGAYQVSPPGRTAASDRYRDGAGAEKTVYINGRPVGQMGARARVFVKDEYARGDPSTTSSSASPTGEYWSREGLVDQTDATYAALRDGGTLYLTGETEDAVYLSTARAKPDGYTAADADDVAVDLEVQPGASGRDVRLLTLRADDDDLFVDCRRDDNILGYMGKSHPPYSHYLGRRQRWRAGRSGDPRGGT